MVRLREKRMGETTTRMNRQLVNQIKQEKTEMKEQLKLENKAKIANKAKEKKRLKIIAPKKTTIGTVF